MRTVAFCALLIGCGTDYRPPPGEDAGPGTGPRFYEDVSPILMKHCVGCHQPGGVAPFSLITLEDATNAARLIPAQVTSRKMPPYNADASGSCNTFQNARALSDAEIATLVDWVDGDRLAGDPAAAPGVPSPPPPLARVDATAAMPVPYTQDATLDNDYRCFIVDAGIATDTFLTGFEVRPGTPEVVHHILMFQLDSADAELAAANLDAQSPGPGYTCFGGVGAAASLIGVWAPGLRVATYPTGTGLPLKAGRKLVLQIHYHDHDGTPQSDQTAVDLMTEATVPNPSFLYLLANTNLYLPPQQPAVTTVNQYQLAGWLPQYNVWGLFPHMHTLGKQLRVEADHGGTTQCLIDVPRWDFNWQQGYFYDTPPLVVGGNDTVRIACTYDTTSRTTSTSWGEGTEDEMCLAFIYVSQR